MGMFDEIIVPKSYLKNLLPKGDEKLLNTKHLFQTKSLDNVMDLYKIHRQQLYRLDRSEFLLKEGIQHTELTDKWIKLNNGTEISFYSGVKDEKNNEYWFEFKFAFKGGKIDKKELVSNKIVSTEEERESIDAMWDKEQEIFNEYRNKNLSYKLFSWIEERFQKMTNWARKKHTLPLEIRKKAYEESGRLEKDPDALKLYSDL
ncbi:uncharacterized protein METZ01_LOCUS208180 [marine metagenome]|uniref:Uncharacterized protein n=1 Tax=marine metagenome TaxID=408172 RepID=A0A382EX66_9ZZZZ|tara:strand:- start:16227 stop:16835 length:609 start_codon:yes stop_codon:yes gene_type:complete